MPIEEVTLTPTDKKSLNSKQTWVKYIVKVFNYKYKYCLQYCI